MEVLGLELDPYGVAAGLLAVSVFLLVFGLIGAWQDDRDGWDE